METSDHTGHGPHYGIKNILVLTDFSGAALNAATYAASLAERLGAGMLLYHSAYVPFSTDVPMEDAVEAAVAKGENKLKLGELKNAIERLVEKRVPVGMLMDERPLVPAIAEIAGERQGLLAAMGITGKSRLEQVLIGSTTFSVAGAIDVPLLIVPEEATFRGIASVVFACGPETPGGTVEIEKIKAIVRALGAQLLVLNVDRYDEHRFNPERKSREAILRNQLEHENATYHFVGNSDIATGISDFAVQRGAGLIIAISRDHGFFGSIFHRSVSKRLAYHTHIPLLLIRENSVQG